MRGLGSDAVFLVRSDGVQLLDFFCSSIQLIVLSSPYLCFISTYIYLDVYALGGIMETITIIWLDPHQH